MRGEAPAETKDRPTRIPIMPLNMPVTHPSYHQNTLIYPLILLIRFNDLTDRDLDGLIFSFHVSGDKSRYAADGSTGSFGRDFRISSSCSAIAEI